VSWAGYVSDQKDENILIFAAGLTSSKSIDASLISKRSIEMIRKPVQVVACSMLCLFFTASNSEMLVAQFEGTGNKTTLEFTAEAPWILDWRINSDYNKMVSFDLDLIDGTTGVLVGNIKSAKQLGNGVRLFEKGGKYKFRINASFIRWHLKVKELTAEEAKLYTPR